MIISLHIYKTAGTSFRNELKQCLGSALHQDYKYDFDNINELYYGDVNNISVQPVTNIAESIKIIHGHFLVDKWLSVYPIDTNTYITWVRDPLERMISHFFYTRKIYSDEKYGMYDWSKTVKEKWSLEEFCFYDKHQNFMTTMLRGIPKESLDFIGITEHFNRDTVSFFKQYFPDIQICPSHHSLKTDQIPPEELFNNSDFIDRFREYHADDYALYDYAVTRQSMI